MSASAHAADPRLPPKKKLKILVADDEPLFRRALQSVLEHRGHEVVTAPDAYKAIESLQSGAFDAVLVDHRMPGGGHRVFSYLEETDFGGVSVLMTGGTTSDTQEVDAEVPRLQKPFPFPAIIPLLEGV